MSTAKVSQFARTGGTGENKNVEDAVKKYEEFHSGEGWNDTKKMSYMDMVNKYYDLSTSFYEWGWGECFHFAHRLTGETLQDSIKRHEHYLAAQGGFKKGEQVRLQSDAAHLQCVSASHCCTTRSCAHLLRLSGNSACIACFTCSIE